MKKVFFAKKVIVSGVLIFAVLVLPSPAWFSSAKKREVKTGSQSKPAPQKSQPAEDKKSEVKEESQNVAASSLEVVATKAGTKKQKQGETAEYQAVTEQLTKTQTKYSALVAQIEKALSEARTKIITLQNNKKKLAAETVATERAIKQLSEINEQRYRDLEVQQGKLEKIEDILKQKNERMGTLLNAVQMAKTMQEKDQQMEKVKQELSELKAQNGAVTKKNSQKVAMLERENLFLKKKAIEQAEIVARLRSELASLKQSAGIQQKDVREMKAELQRLRAVVAETEKEEQRALAGVSSSIREFEDFLSTQTEK